MRVKLKYILEDVDRHGNRRIYVRRGERKLRVRAALGTPEFLEEYRAAVAAAARPAPEKEERPFRAMAGTLQWLADEYMRSGEFKRLDQSTQRARRGLFDLICASKAPNGKKRGDLPYRGMEARHVRKLRDEHADAPAAANGRVKALRQAFAWAISAGLADRNPARDVPYFTGGTDGFHTWTLDEVAQFGKRHPPGTKAHKALALMLYTGARRSDVVRLGRQMARDGWLKFTEAKGRARGPKHREIPILPELQAAIDAAPSGNLTFLVTEFGKPFTAAGFGNWFRRRCNEAGLSHCSAHGLRKAGATIAANNGATEHQLMAIFGWASPKQAAIYTRHADRRRLAGEAMHLLAPAPTGEGRKSQEEGDGLQTRQEGTG